MTYQDIFRAVGVAIPNLLLPNKEVDLSRFAVIACDQFSARPDYWQRVEATTAGHPSAMHMIFPEAYLSQGEQRGKEIVQNMHHDLDTGILEPLGEGMVYLHRETSSGLRRGLMVLLDLEQYEYRAQSQTLIRATEKTVEERLPLRIAIRREAPLELPHVMVLLDDPKDLLLGPLKQLTTSENQVYDFPLMEGGGQITGWKLNTTAAYEAIAQALHTLYENCDGLLFAMGDGNHSFAAAKVCWDALKSTLSAEEQQNHPARYSLVELVNLYDDANRIEPIHRLVLHVNPQDLQQELGFDGKKPPSLQILQPQLDAWLSQHPEAELEYIHEAEECQQLEAQDPKNRLAIVFGPFEKDSLFDVVREQGVFARKSFSIGLATDKRYYLESRKIQ